VTSRAVFWGDLQNAWDLGGLPTATGTTRFGRLYRSMGPDDLDAAGCPLEDQSDTDFMAMWGDRLHRCRCAGKTALPNYVS
jgi:hypothetical protein